VKKLKIDIPPISIIFYYKQLTKENLMTRIEREELNLLSKQAFGTTSKWQKLVNDGVKEPFERERKVMVPTSKGLREKTFVDRKSVLRRYTVEEVKKLMTDILAKTETGACVAKGRNDETG